jgi:GNAT superfamily N-acetyltransferase
MAAYLASAFSPEKQAAEIAAPDGVFLIVEADSRIAGYARLKESQPPDCISGERPIEIVRFYSAQEWIGKGVGAQLMKACLDEAERRGCATLWLDVWEHNPRAIAFYKKWGFETVGAQAFQLGADLQNDLLMERPVRL